MNFNLVNSAFSSTNAITSQVSTKLNQENGKFEDLIKAIKAREENSLENTRMPDAKGAGVVRGTAAGETNAGLPNSTLASSQIISDGRLSGDVKSGFAGSFTSAGDKSALPSGAAANQANSHVQAKKIDKTSKLYEKSMELESYFVKQMLSEMRKTVNKSSLGGGGFAGEMYQDMLYEEYATSMTKNAGFGLADQIYLSLV